MNIPLGGHEGHEGGAFTDEISALTRKTQEMVSFSLLYEEMARQWSINQGRRPSPEPDHADILIRLPATSSCWNHEKSVFAG